jgi:heme exporter protein D
LIGVNRNLSELLTLDGYGAFVWPAYLIATVVLVGLYLTVQRGLARDRRTLSALEAERQSRRSTPLPVSREADSS